MENGKDDQYVVLRSDRRKNLRKQLLVLKVKGEDKRGAFFGYAKTLGKGGMFIASVNPRKVGEEFDITFRLGDKGPEIRCRCAVVWVREYTPHKQDPGMGIKFVNMDEATRNMVDEWVKKTAEKK